MPRPLAWLRRWRAPRAWRGWRRSRGRILAVKWGVNPNSSSLGADVTFLLFGVVAVALLTPLVGLWLRARGVLLAAPQHAPAAGGADARESSEAAAVPSSGGTVSRQEPR